jgi:hypothetical protein
MIATDYAIEFVAPCDIKPSPENDDIYGIIKYDDQMNALISSIDRRGLEEPIIVSSDNYIISGHRRYFAAKELRLGCIPIRRKGFSRESRIDEWHRILAEYNPQRIKSVSTLLKEALLARSEDDPRALLHDHDEDQIERTTAVYCDVDGAKILREITEKKAEFLAAVKKVVSSLREFWPLTIRQIHYNLLNDPPLTLTPKRSKFDIEHFRYRNDAKSYDKLVSLLTPARYAGEVPMNAIDDPTRPKVTRSGYFSLDSFLHEEVDGFLCGYHVDKQMDQPRHIEVLGEKGTLMGILRPVCADLYIPLSLGRGYSSIPVFREISERFKSSRKKRMTLIVVSDYDPEGLDLADDAVRTLRDLWNIPVDYHRVGVNREQIDELDLASDFNPAKETSTRLQSFIDKTGGTETWEVEALSPTYVREETKKAILANMDMEIYDRVKSWEVDDVNRLHQIRREVLEMMDL